MSIDHGNTTRRGVLKGAAAALALAGAARAALPAGAFAQGAGPEVKGAKLGFIALTDAAPLFVAKEKGIFAKYNLDVASRLVRDYPEFDRKTGDELRAEPKAIWTDIPGQPRGGP